MYKSIKGYEGFYEVSELGKVLSIDRIVECKDGSTRKRKGKELKPETHIDGYTLIKLSKNCINKMMTVHRLVAETFLPNPDNLPQVHHINHDRTDNRVHNLKWVNDAEQRDDHWRAAQGTKLRVVGHGIDKIFISAHEVERELEIASSYVLQVAKGIRKQAKGYRIYFAD